MSANEKWEHPQIQDLDNLSFVLLRDEVYKLLHELHMAENYKIVNPEKEHNVYWENFCDLVKYMKHSVDETICRGESDS